MQHEFHAKVYYADTDSYGVVWHGAYLRWLEAGRVEFCAARGICIKEMQKQGIVLPVVNLNVRYKASATMGEKVLVVTKVKEIGPTSITFSQTIKNDAKTFVVAEVCCVALGEDGKLIKKLPIFLKEALSNV